MRKIYITFSSENSSPLFIGVFWSSTWGDQSHVLDGLKSNRSQDVRNGWVFLAMRRESPRRTTQRGGEPRDGHERCTRRDDMPRDEHERRTRRGDMPQDGQERRTRRGNMPRDVLSETTSHETGKSPTDHSDSSVTNLILLISLSTICCFSSLSILMLLLMNFVVLCFVFL